MEYTQSSISDNVDKQDETKPYAVRWLWLGVWALALAGIFAVILVVARTPQLKAFSLFHDLFSVALVVHVDLSVLTWFLAAIAVAISLSLQHSKRRFLYAEPAAFWSMAAGMLCLTFSPLFGEWEVVKSNYIPVLYNAVFFLGLSLMAAGMLILSLERVWLARALHRVKGCSHHMDSLVLALVILVALVAFYASGELLPAGYDHNARYEYLFWAGGHTLQFAFILMMVLAWGQLFQARYASKLLSCRLLAVVCGLVLVGVAMPLYVFWLYPVDSDEFQSAFTKAMIEFGGLAPMLALVVLFIKMAQKSTYAALPTRKDAALTALISSIVLFLAGGGLGLLITGQNVTIPAHYHGSIVGVTLALMGYAYVLMPQLGYSDVRQQKMAVWQPVIYGIGQLMHIGGLGYSGGYGVLRKTAVGNTEFATDIKIALGIMGLGGLLAIIGGLLFVVVMARASLRKR